MKAMQAEGHATFYSYLQAFGLTKLSGIDVAAENTVPLPPAAPVVRPTDLGQNQQLRARGFWEAVDHPVTGTHELPGLPFRFAGGPDRWTRTPPPTLGQHNEDVLVGELGVGRDELGRLRATAVVGDRPLGA